MDKIRIYYTDSFDGKSSHALLKDAVAHYTGAMPDSFDVHRERGKKPYFVGRADLHFSISHSGGIWACAFAPGNVGLDVQVKDEKRSSVELAERFFHPDEANEVRCADNIVDAFTHIWSRKEAVVKLFGIGIDGRFSQFDSRGETIEFLEEAVRIADIALPVTEDHSAAVAYSGKFEIEIIKLK